MDSPGLNINEGIYSLDLVECQLNLPDPLQTVQLPYQPDVKSVEERERERETERETERDRERQRDDALCRPSNLVV